MNKDKIKRIIKAAKKEKITIRETLMNSLSSICFILFGVNQSNAYRFLNIWRCVLNYLDYIYYIKLSCREKNNYNKAR